MSKPNEMQWEIAFPLLTNPWFMADYFKMMGIAYLLIGILMSILFLAQGEADALGQLMLLFFYILIGFFVLSVLIMLVYFRNRMHCRFAMDKDGIHFQLLDKRARSANRAAIVLGFLAGKPGLAGSGMLAQSQEQDYMPWSGVARAVYSPSLHSIRLRNRWRTRIVVYCSAQNYPAVEEFIRQRLAEQVPAANTASPLPATLGRSALALLACLPLFGMPYPFELDLFIPIFLICFSQATIWLASLLGYAVIAGVLWTLGEIVWRGMQTHRSMFSDAIYSGFDTIRGDEWLAFMVLLAGLGYLAWISLRAVTGKKPSLLEQDLGEG